jgi:hypothetical protein
VSIKGIIFVIKLGLKTIIVLKITPRYVPAEKGTQ